MSTQRFEKPADSFPEYIFSSLAKSVAEVENATGKKVLNLGPGSPDIQPSSVYLDQLARFIQQSDSHLYPGYAASAEFSQAVKGWYKNRFGVSISSEGVLPLLGAKDAVCHLPIALLAKNDEILVPNPGYPGFSAPAAMIGAKPVPYDLLPENSFALSIQSLEKKVTRRTRCVWVNFPSNPTGCVASVEDLQMVVNFCKKHNLILLYDNAYSEITFDGMVAPSILQVPGAAEVAVEVGSFSKSFSFAGYRMGWIVGNQEIITALAKVKSQFDSGLSLPLQRLGAYALTHQDKQWHKKMLLEYQKRRDVIVAKLETLGLTCTVPKGALYVWAKLPQSAASSTDFCMNLLREKQILLTPGIAFGSNGDRYVRASICSNISSLSSYV